MTGRCGGSGVGKNGRAATGKGVGWRGRGQWDSQEGVAVGAWAGGPEQ